MIVDSWSEALDKNNEKLFDGTEDSVKLLTQQVQDGRVLEADFTMDEADVQNAFTKALYGYLAPKAWALSNQDLHPVVV